MDAGETLLDTRDQLHSLVDLMYGLDIKGLHNGSLKSCSPL